jgi:hypothetical protein
MREREMSEIPDGIPEGERGATASWISNYFVEILAHTGEQVLPRKLMFLVPRHIDMCAESSS